MRQNCEVDVLLVSKASGVLLCEVKDKGHTWEARAATAQEQQERDAAVAKEMRKAAQQLDHAEKVMSGFKGRFLVRRTKKMSRT